MTPFQLSLFKAFVQLRNEAERTHFCITHPVLLSAAVRRQLSAEVGQWSKKQQGDAATAVAHLDAVCDRLKADPTLYPLGEGPVDSIWVSFKREALSPSKAVARAQAQEVHSIIGHFYAWLISRLVETVMHQAPLDALDLQYLLLLAAEAGPDVPVSAKQAVRLTFIESATRALHQAPNGGLLSLAGEVVRRLVAQARSDDDSTLLGLALHRAAILYLDPYVMERQRESYRKEIEAWMSREGRYPLLDRDRPADGMPDPQSAFMYAESYLRDALPFRKGQDRALSLKALVQTLQWREMQGAEVDRLEIAKLAREAVLLGTPEFLDRDGALLRRTIEVYGGTN